MLKYDTVLIDHLVRYDVAKRIFPKHGYSPELNLFKDFSGIILLVEGDGTVGAIHHHYTNRGINKYHILPNISKEVIEGQEHWDIHYKPKVKFFNQCVYKALTKGKFYHSSLYFELDTITHINTLSTIRNSSNLELVIDIDGDVVLKSNNEYYSVYQNEIYKLKQGVKTNA